MMNHYDEKGLELAQAYIPFQTYGSLYPPAEALKKGTLFPELYRPYEGCRTKR